MNCINYDITKPEDAVMAFDFLYNIFCMKFHRINLAEEIMNEDRRTGVFMLVDGIIEENIQTLTNTKKAKDKEMWKIIKIVLAIFAIVLVVLYYMGIYFALLDEDSDVERKKR